MSAFEGYDLLVVQCYPGINMRGEKRTESYEEMPTVRDLAGQGSD